MNKFFLLIMICFLRKYFGLSMEERLKSTSCEYHLKISTPSFSLMNNKFKYKFIFQEKMNYRNNNIIEELYSIKHSVDEERELAKGLIKKPDFYTINIFNRLLMYGTHSSFKMSNSELSIEKKEEFIFDLYGIKCNYKLSLARFTKRIGLREINNNFYIEFLFVIDELNRFHLKLDANEFQKYMKTKKEIFNKFTTFSKRTHIHTTKLTNTFFQTPNTRQKNYNQK